MMRTVFKDRQSRLFAAFLGIVTLVLPIGVWAAVPEERATRMAEREAERATNMAERQAERTERIEERQENRETKREEVADRRQELFCSTFAASAGRIAANLSERQNRFEERKENRVGTIDENRDNRDGGLADHRSDADERRNDMYAVLESKADTDAEKAAVAAFKKTVEGAIDTRRDTLDAALEAFRTGVDDAIAGRKDDMDKAASQFTAAVSTAVDQAKKQCEDGATPATVRTTFQNALAAARASLEEDRKTSEKIKEQVQALADARKATFAKAVSDFKATMETAKADLRKAFGNDADL